MVALVAFVASACSSGDDGGAAVDAVGDDQAITEAAEGDATDATETVATTPPATGAPSAAPIDATEGAPQVWKVTGVDDSLNVRATPGVDAELVGALPAGSSSIQGTGRTTDVDGIEWREIAWGDGVAWVSSAYLAPDDTPPATAAAQPSTPGVSAECYRGAIEGVPAALVAQFAPGGATLTGSYRLDDDATADATFDGTRQAPQLFDVVVTRADGSTSNASWQFDVDGIVSSNGWRVDAVGCADLGAAFDELVG